MSQTETPFCPDAAARVRVHEGAAAGRQHLRPAIEEARNDALFAGTEIGLAVGGEDFRDRHAGRSLDLGVGVHKTQSEALREPPANRRLAGAHHPHQHDRPLPERCEQCAVLRRNSNLAGDDVVHYSSSG